MVETVDTSPLVKRWHNARTAPLLCALFVISFGLYFFVWSYKTWRFIRQESSNQPNPLLRTLGLFVPVVSAVFLFQLFKYVRDLTADTEEQVDNEAGRRMPGVDYKMIVLWAAFSLSTNFLAARGWWVLPGLGSVLLITPLQRRINDYWARKYGVRPPRTPLAVWIVLLPLAVAVIAARVAG